MTDTKKPNDWQVCVKCGEVFSRDSAFEELQTKLAVAKEALEFYAKHKTSVIEITKSPVIESNFINPGSIMTSVKTLDNGEIARKALEELNV